VGGENVTIKKPEGKGGLIRSLVVGGKKRVTFTGLENLKEKR